MHIHIIGKFYSHHSLAIVNRNIAIELSKLCKVTIKSLDSGTHEILDALKVQDSEIPDIEIRHYYPPTWERPADSRKVVYIQPWEYCRVPFEWQYKFETFADHVIVPSEWTRDVYVQSGLCPTKISVIPNGYDPKIFYPDDSRNNDEHIVLYVGCHQFRKGLDILLQAWPKAFPKYDVKLIIKDNPAIYGQNNLKEKCGHIKNVSIIDAVFTDAQMALLYQKAHCLVHPYRGESFGMHICEGIACGAWPLVTNGGPTDEFATGDRIESNKRVVDLTKIFAGKPGDAFTLMGSHAWVYEASVEDLAKNLKAIVSSDKRIPSTENIKTWEEVAQMYFSLFQKKIS